MNFKFKVNSCDEGAQRGIEIESCEPRMRGKVATANRLQIQTLQTQADEVRSSQFANTNV